MTSEERLRLTEEQVYRNVLGMLRHELPHLPREHPHPSNADHFADASEKGVLGQDFLERYDPRDAETFWEAAKRGHRRAWREHWRTGTGRPAR